MVTIPQIWSHSNDAGACGTCYFIWKYMTAGLKNSYILFYFILFRLSWGVFVARYARMSCLSRCMRSEIAYTEQTAVKAPSDSVRRPVTLRTDSISALRKLIWRQSRSARRLCECEPHPAIQTNELTGRDFIQVPQCAHCDDIETERLNENTRTVFWCSHYRLYCV